MKRLVVACSCLPLALSAAVTGVWTNLAEDSGPTNPLVWTAEDNWRDKVVPLTIADSADFKSSPPSSASLLRWIRLPDEFALKAFLFSGSSGIFYFIGEELTLGTDFTTGTSAGTNIQRLYANVTTKPTNAALSTYFQRTDLCGDISDGYNIGMSYGYLRHRLDLYANEAGETRVNPFSTYSIQQSYGDFAMIAPESSATDLSSDWTLSTDSKIVTRVDMATARHALPVGTLVTAANGALPAGTFLRRIYDDNTIELSETPTQPGATTLTFAAFTPSVSQTIGQINHAGCNQPFHLLLSKYRPEDSFRVTVEHLNRPAPSSTATAESLRVIFDVEPGLVPATTVLRGLWNVKTHVVFGDCDIEFAKPVEDGPALGFTDTPAARQKDATVTSRLTVTNNLTATIPVFTNLVGSVVKSGAGTLVVGLTNAVDNTGTLTVSEGTLRVLDNGETGLPYVKELALDAAATLEVPASGFKADTLDFAAGATVKGGPLYVMTPTDATGLVLADGAEVLYASDDGVVSSDIAANIVSNMPAFWVDALNEDSFVGYEENGTNFVTRWADTRETDLANPTYMFATNLAAAAPQRRVRQGVDSTLTYVNFDNHTTTVAEEMEHLAWSEPLKNIRAVFMVRDPGVGCGQALLGGTKRIQSRYEDFRRNSKEGISITAQFFQSDCSSFVKNGRHYLNGEATTWQGHYPYGMYSNGGDIWLRPSLQEVHTSGDCWADCFGAYGPGVTGYSSFNGYDTICECIVFTNELTEAERLGVEQYLLNKWVKKTVGKARFVGATKTLETLTLDGTTAYAVAADARLNVGAVSGAGTFEKGGSGTVYVDSLRNESAGLKVAGGEMIVRSVKPSRTTLPAGAYIHLDASDDATLGKTLKDDGVTYGLETWSDCRGAGYLTATHSTTNLPSVATVTINGAQRQVVDFGPRMSSSGSTLVALNKATSMTFDHAPQLRTVAVVIGSRQGGGVISGSTKSSAVGGIPRENNGSNASDKLYLGGSTFPRYLQYGLYQNNYPGGTSWRVNGVEVNSRATGLSGSFDLVVVRTPDAFGCNALSAWNYSFECGGQEIGEIIYWDRMLTDEETLRVEAYLREKWFGDALPEDFTGASAGAIEVASGATLRVEGGAPLAVKSISGGGAVEGGVVLGNDSDIVVPVAADGSTPTLTLGSVNVGCGANLSFTGTVRKLAVGEHVIVSSPAIHAGDAVGWSVSGLTANRTCVLKAVEGALVADVAGIGGTFILK